MDWPIRYSSFGFPSAIGLCYFSRLQPGRESYPGTVKTFDVLGV